MGTMNENEVKALIAAELGVVADEELYTPNRAERRAEAQAEAREKRHVIRDAARYVKRENAHRLRQRAAKIRELGA